ncbi:MAG: protein-L-isoaspartate(D-aspartate) O-methyltransferase [Gammaproteobacteria bacterium]|nr:protein-L-isoaspartate(D-aspartate) O-methyltransferase [Gammaproteobacteria bacterium]
MKKSLTSLIADIEAEVKYTRSLTGKDKLDTRVMNAMANTPREQFVPDDLRYQAFNNGPLPIGYRQTISQPYIVALMTDLLDIKPEHRILEIGTGSGYQTAILAQLCTQVYTVECIPQLCEAAVNRFKQMRFNNIKTLNANGYLGWPEYAPYDGIIVTAAAPHIPEALIEQLKPGGKMVIPVGLPSMHQELMLLNKDTQANIDTKSVLDVAFVPLVDQDNDNFSH